MADTKELLSDEELDQVVGGAYTTVNLTKDNAQDFLEKNISFSYTGGHAGHQQGTLKGFSVDKNGQLVLKVEYTLPPDPSGKQKKITRLFTNISDFQVEQ